jgi:hypothetical protein
VERILAMTSGVTRTHRPATLADLDALSALIQAAIVELQRPFLDRKAL